MEKKSIIYIVLTAFFFGTLEVASKLGGASFNAIQLVFLRFLIGGVMLLPFAIHDLKKRAYKLTKSDLLYLLGLGFICVCISMAMLQYGVKRINANLASIIISMNPLFTMIFARFLVGEPFTKKKALVLHGASSVLKEFVDKCNAYGGDIPGAQGVPEEMIREATKYGICKVNIDTDLRLAMTAEVRKYIAENPTDFDPRKYLGPGRDAIQTMVQHKIKNVLNASGTL